MLVRHTIMFIMIFSSCAKKIVPAENQNLKYFDENYIQVSKEEFDIRSDTLGLYKVVGDSAHHRVLTLSTLQGMVERQALDSILVEQLAIEIDPQKLLMICYYPGPDPCNTSGSATKKSLQKNYEALENELAQLGLAKPLYIYRIEEKLERYELIGQWHKDPNQLIKQVFFNYYYPCFSFVVVAPSGYHISSFGEYSNTHFIDVVKQVIKHEQTIEITK